MVTLSLIATTEDITQVSGAGSVVTHELKAQAQVFDKVKVIDARLIRPDYFQVPFNPFFIDYVARHIIRTRFPSFDLAHFNGDPFGLAVEEIHNKNPDCKIVVDCPAHDLGESVKEFEKEFGEYPHKHMTNRYLFDLYMKHATDADLVITPSIMSREWLKKNFSIKDFAVVRHGTTIPEYASPPVEFNVGYLGAIGPDKGLRYLMTAWTGFQKDDALLYMAGPHTKELQPWQELMAKENPNAPMVLVGFAQNKWHYLSNLSVYVQPSVTEGFGITILEAMASGRPVIASAGAGAAELIKDGKSGFVVPPRDPIAILEKLMYFYHNQSEIKTMGDRARQTAKRYTWDKIEKKYIQIYQELIS